MLYLLSVLLLAVSFGDENCNGIIYTDSNGKVNGFTTGKYRYIYIVMIYPTFFIPLIRCVCFSHEVYDDLLGSTV